MRQKPNGAHPNARDDVKHPGHALEPRAPLLRHRRSFPLQPFFHRDMKGPSKGGGGGGVLASAEKDGAQGWRVGAERGVVSDG